ncbi:Intraflagellar transport protein 172-like protein [Hypsibius exemplaris]|uniref:Intraflagellar transport protein 172-like protein n=1 Tax=Hypsibius exemplaris TaxID=2072580 RepID=A0A1W0WNY5_HYPEX|nr:Intraflagellar transport protein 172-like protein [Hypsibius exemplaris]
MKIEYEKTLGTRKLSKQNDLFPVQALAWAPNDRRIAYCDDDRCVWVYDDSWEYLIHFPTKPVEKEFGKNSYVVTGIAFSPDSTKLAVAQSDAVVFVYRLPKEKDKSELAVVFKYPQSSPVTAVTWMAKGNLIFGLQDGSVRHASSSKRSDSINESGSQVITAVGNNQGSVLLTGHLDGSVHTYTADKESFRNIRKLFTAPKPFICLVFPGDSILLGGSDQTISVYNSAGKFLQEIPVDSQDSHDGQRLTAAVAAPNGRSAVFACFNRLRVLNYVPRKGVWTETTPLTIKNLLVVPALAWNSEGTKLATASLFGAVDIFNCALGKKKQNSRFETTFVTADQAVIRDPETNRRMTVRSDSGQPIDRLNFLKDQPIAIGETADHLIVADIKQDLASEVPWEWKRDVPKPTFHINGLGCVVYYANALHILELGRSDLLYTLATPNFYARLFSLHLTKDRKMFACLPSRKALRVVNLQKQEVTATFRHDVDLDWITFNNDCAMVVGRDVRLALLLFNVATKEKTVLCGKATFADLVEGTDVLVAQEGKQIRAWFNVADGKDGLTEKTLPIIGKVTEVTHLKGQLTIHTQNGSETNIYTLEDDAGQLENYFAKMQLEKAFDFLVAAGDAVNKESQWQNLVNKALDSKNFQLAEKAFETTKDPRAKDVRDITTRIQQLQKEHGRSMDDILGHYTVKATLERLKGNYDSAEKILLAQKDHKRAIVMYSNAGQYVRALKVAEENEPALVSDLIIKYQQQLSKEGKIYQLGEILAHTGQLGEAAALYAGTAFQPLDGYKLLVSYPAMVGTKEGKRLAERVLPVMQESGLDEMVGRTLELLGDVDGALKAFRSGHCYDHAIEFARQRKPEQVVPLEAECARYLVNIHNWQDAIGHFIEANLNTDALDAAIHCHDFDKAAQILTVVEDSKEAVEMYKKIGKPKEAIKMFLSRSKIEEAYQYAETFVKPEEIKNIFRKEAEGMITEKRYAEAEKMLLQIGDIETVIRMYRDSQQFQRWIDLVKKYQEHALGDTYAEVAQAYRKMGSLRQAELYFARAQKFKETVQMYVEEEKWPDAYRCALESIKEMADDILYLWITQIGFRDGIPILRNLNAARNYVIMALRAGEYDDAHTVASETAPELLPEIRKQRAVALAQTGHHLDAEKEFLAAGQADQAVQMYIDAGNWPDAVRLTTLHFPEELPHVLMSYAGLLADAGRFQEAEDQMMSINRPDLVIKMYKEHAMLDDALRVAKQFRPAEVRQLEMESGSNERAQTRTAKPGDNILRQARNREEKSDYIAAVQLYLKYLAEASSTDSAQQLRVCGRVRELSLSFLSDAEAREFIDIVASKYLTLNRPALAAAAFAEIGQQDKALQVFMDNGEWEEARALAMRAQDGQLTKTLEARYRDFLRTQGKVEQLSTVDGASAVEIYARNGEWEKCLKVCMELRDLKLLAKYLYDYGVILLKSGEDTKVMELFTNHGAPVTEDTINIYRHIFCTFVAKTMPDIATGFRTWVGLRELILAVGENLLRHSAEISVGVTAEFEKYLQIAVYYSNHYAFVTEDATKELAWMALLSLLRYSDVINPDKAFYDAGRAAQQLNWTGTADSLMNTYLDWRECIIRQNIDLVDYSQFAGSDIPTNVSIPKDHSVSAEEYESVKNWILKSALNQSLKFELKKDERGVFEISLSGGRYPPCVLTGFPVLSNGVKLGTSGRQARKQDLNRFLQTVRGTRNEKLEDVRRFLVKWCGAATELNYAFV